MRPPGFLALRDVCTWLGQNPARDYAATRKLLARRGLAPAAQSLAGHRPLLWRWSDLQPLAPPARTADRVEAA